MILKISKLFLRVSIAFSFLSAVADRLGMWSKEVSVWGDWTHFLEYTQILNPWAPKPLVSFLATTATVAEIIFAVCILVGFKTRFFARLSGYLMLLFALAMCFTTGIKSALDYSVFTASAAAFALSVFNDTFLELDGYLKKE